MQHVMLIGNPADGFVVVGPFPDHDAAVRYMETDPEKESMWIVELHAPAQEEDER
jgi:hypothetical protein